MAIVIINSTFNLLLHIWYTPICSNYNNFLRTIFGRFFYAFDRFPDNLSVKECDHLGILVSEVLYFQVPAHIRILLINMLKYAEDYSIFA